MKLVADLRALWRDGGALTRAALVTLGVSVTVHLLALGGLSALDLGYPVLFIPHLTVMVLGFALLGGGYDKRYRTFRRRYPFRSPWPIPIPWRVVILEAFFAIYLAGWVVYLVTRVGEGSPEPHDGGYAWMNRGQVVRELTYGEFRRLNADFLGIFSATWCFFSLGIALIQHRYTVRMRQLRDGDDAMTSLPRAAADAIVPSCPSPTSPERSTSSAPPKR